VALEFRRREEERKFWEAYKSTQGCCGTMNNCPLKTGD
jgi:hypothetical protein